MNIQGIIKCRR